MASATGRQEEQHVRGGAWPFAALLGGNAALALGPWLVRLTDTGPVAAGFWRLAFPLPLFLLLAWREGAARAIDWRTTGLLLLAGAFFAFDLASWHIGIEMTRLGNSTLFGNSGSLVLMIWGLVALRRAPTRPETAAVVAALAGGAILLGESLQISARTLAGDLFCVLAGIFYVGYLLPAQRARETLGQWSVLSLVCVTGAPILLVIALASGEPVWPRAAGWTPVLGLALCSQVIGQGLLVYALRHFSALVIGMALLTQPALAALTGWLAFDEVLAPLDLLGMALVATALVIARIVPGKP